MLEGIRVIATIKGALTNENGEINNYNRHIGVSEDDSSNKESDIIPNFETE